MRRKRPVKNARPIPEPIVSLRRVSRFYRVDRPALFDATLDIYPGEFVYIAGSSGAGKSTLLKLIHTLERPDTGTLLYSGHDISRLKRSAIAVLRQSMGVVFQDFMLVPDMTLQANVGLPLEIAGLSMRLIEARVAAALSSVGLGGRENELAGSLSGGEQQRVAIARALVGEPEIILADEPTGNLDAYNADFVLDLLEQANARGTTVLLATHDRMLMAARPHRLIALEQGRIVGMSSHGTPDDSPSRDHQRRAG